MLKQKGVLPINVQRTYDKNHSFLTAFDMDSGLYYRSSIIDAQGAVTGIDPFQASYPHLLDIGIMGHCIHGSQGLCLKAGIECYQNGLELHRPHMSFDAYRKIIDESKGKLFQVALGGRGDPDQHPDIETILAYTRDANIIPNMTTSGLGLTTALALVIRQYCGAVAVSWYRSDYTLKAIDLLVSAGVKTNIHYVLSNASIDEAIDRMKNDGFPDGINRVVFLLHKPIGLGSAENVLKWHDPKVQYFFSLFDESTYNSRAGFDSCSIPALLQLAPNVASASIDTCEGARFSAYISSDSIMVPCSFDQKERWAVDLTQFSIKEAWDSPPFDAFRQHLKGSCKSCLIRRDCYGGCPIANEIVLCDRKERVYENQNGLCHQF